MQIVRLSGGSGMRLWPLSNDTRSKQFLRVLQSPTGDTESMIMRIVRQINEAQLGNEITIATNIKQKDAIENQLGDSVSIVTEPERRDTFPAIALTCDYLRKVKQCSSDEIVVIMPCDPYTEDEYFQVIKRMAEVASQGVSNLVLMGITPTYASTKFGYVVPQKNSRLSVLNSQFVERFTEKPDEETAQQLIKQGAMWNGGVFAFKLGYLTQINDKYLQADTFEEFRSRYTELPKISFDYEVAEKAASVSVVPFEGLWEDLGTWNALSKRLASPIVGNVLLGNHVENVEVVNELSVPLFCEGLNDVIIAANPDGIMICSKEYTETIKSYVSKLQNRPMYEERRWGTYRVLDDSYYSDGRHSLTKSVTLKEGKHISYQRHHHRSETWTFVQGEGVFVLDGVEQKVKAGDTVAIPVEHWHAIKATAELTFIEVQSGNPLIEEDIERMDWEWARL